MDEDCPDGEGLPECDVPLMGFWGDEIGRGEGHEDGGDDVA